MPDSVEIVFLDESGADLSAASVRKVERIFQRQEFRRAFPGEIGDLSFPPRAVESYVQELRSSIDSSRIEGAGLKVVVDTAGGVASMVMPTLLARLPVEVLTVNNRLDDDKPTETAAMRADGLRRLGELVSSARATSGCGSTRSASGYPSSTTPDARSTTNGRCWSSSTWSPPSGRPGGWRCR